MAMKPVGKAIIAGVVVLGVLGGAHFSGLFDKLKKQGEEAAAVTAPVPTQSPSEPVAPAPERSIVAEPQPAPKTPIPQPINSPLRQSDAFDQLIRQSGSK